MKCLPAGVAYEAHRAPGIEDGGLYHMGSNEEGACAISVDEKVAGVGGGAK